MRQEITLHIDLHFEAEDDLWIAEVRQLQGLWASGKTVQDAIDATIAMIPSYYETFENLVGVEIVDAPKIVDASKVDDVDDAERTVRVLAGAC